MAIELIAVVRRIIRACGGSLFCLTSVDLIYPDGRDCGVSLFVEGWQGAAELLMKLGVSSEDLEEHRAHFKKDAEICIPLTADEDAVREMGFNPREVRSRGS